MTHIMDMQENWVSPGFVRKKLSITASVLARLRDRGMPYLQIGPRSYRYRLSEVIKFLSTPMQQSNGGADGESKN